jgi:hypothetical protein
MSEAVPSRDAIAKAVSDAFAARGQEVETEFLDQLIADLERTFAGSAAQVVAPKSLAQQFAENLGAAAEQVEASNKAQAAARAEAAARR